MAQDVERRHPGVARTKDHRQRLDTKQRRASARRFVSRTAGVPPAISFKNAGETPAVQGVSPMAELTGSEILARSLRMEGIKDCFYIMGGPMLLAESCMIKEGIRMIDVRHEQAAAFAAQAYSRLTQKVGICMAASGPAAINLSTGLANALIDCCPVVGFGGASPTSQFGRQVFQEIDQMAIMRGCVKYADRIHNLKR